MKYIKGLDTLRAFAVMLVIFAHWWIPLDVAPHKRLCHWISAIVPNGGFGVDLFFVLSGFLITSILLEARKKADQPGLRIIQNFIIRRALRIFPVYYLTLFAFIYMGYPFIKEHLKWFLLYMSNMLTFKMHSWNNFSHTWSLAVEEQFYLMWPWFIVFVRKKYLDYVFYGAIAIGLVSAIYVMSIQRNWTGCVLTTTCMQAFGIGGLFAYLREEGRQELFLKFITIAFPVALVFYYCISFSSEEVKDKYDFLSLLINSLISVWLIRQVIYNKSEWLKKYILENRMLNKIGQISYGIYLFHYAFSFFYEKLIRHFFIPGSTEEVFLLDWKHSYFIRLALLFLISLASFHLFEKPVMSLKKYFNY